ncbi:hypothetical protein CLIB1444_13S00166 [[Candida] jaroonii]|uniref:Uncharacterized protein n=1 Tax=[Candida] jaroonii TaxID=467808 RepID=A0ACA9YEK4_9ASCO|nr:hypothetical protein CLIB1444_13S00166 [[Candida] jaroonii]
MLRVLIPTTKTGSRRLYSTEFPTNINSKPNISQFKTPLLHTFLIASTTYLLLNTIAMTLEYEEEKQKIENLEKSIEFEIQTVIDNKKKQLESRWYQKIPFFWKS